jgi:hypothetical protein
MGEKQPGRLNRKNRTVRTEWGNGDHGVLVPHRTFLEISQITNDIGVEPMCATRRQELGDIVSTVLIQWFR